MNVVCQIEIVLLESGEVKCNVKCPGDPMHIFAALGVATNQLAGAVMARQAKQIQVPKGPEVQALLNGHN